MIPKNTRIKNKKLRDFAKGQQCTLNIANVCQYRSDTTVWAHYNFDGGKMGGKANDHSGGIACYLCHSVIDGHKPYSWENPHEKYLYMGRSMVRSRTLAIQAGVVNG